MTNDSEDILHLSEFLPYRLAVLSNRISRAIADRYEERFQITLPEWRVMAVLGEKPNISASEVAELSAMDKVAVSRAVNKLIDTHKLERHFALEDKRRSVLALSNDGQQVYDDIVPLALSYEQTIIEQLTDVERTVLKGLLDKLDDIQLSM